MRLFSRLACATWGGPCLNIGFFEPSQSVLARTFCSFWLFYHDPRVNGFFKVSGICELRVDDESISKADAWLEKHRLDREIPFLQRPTTTKRRGL